ncbi:glycoside hydrolase family 97 protein [Cellulophaga sp. F20128]|uniref:glycoside hydrolase family 97 protein n=1 Tax=Cellulophaga sp. F20128 TaxID=2926413 RepID=UPI001FF57EF4|nr:glycoside hydrolase family 97 protein [Cellulophaga sp. F20128]MCK0158318.1 glycoside hydrolase family 97 protein [Cellulophaga sp. F20128]
MKFNLALETFPTLRCYALLSAVIFILNACTTTVPNLTVTSPDGNVSLVMGNDNGKISYALSSEGKQLVHASELSILAERPTAKILGSSLHSEDTTWQPVWGQFSEIRNHYNELVVTIDLDGIPAKLYARAYDNGIGFRYELEGYANGTPANFYCEYNLNSTDILYCPAGEGTPFGPSSIAEVGALAKQPKLMMPLVIESSAQVNLSFLESDLVVAPEFGVIKFTYDQAKEALISSNKTKLTAEKTTTPWRVILINDKPGDLVTNTVPLNLATPNKIADPSWIQPGKTMWDWRVHGYTTKDGFTYGIDTESYIRFIDFAAEKGIEYFLIDDSWYTKVTKGHFEISEKFDIEKVSKYAHDKGVKLILYYDRHKGSYGDEALFPYYKSLGMSGIKYGFMGTNVSFTSAAIQNSAENHLLIDFHDSPVPFTGIERTYPNAITKEYCHAQQDSRRAFTPETFIKMALINAIQGPLDMNNGNFDLIGINNGSRQKGPKKQHSYFSTVASEAARTLIIYSGLVCIPDAPEAYREKSDLFEFIEKMPVGKWDESKVLHAKMGEYISTARRHGEEWFIGSVYNQKGGTLQIELDFLKEDQKYSVTYYEDTPETHCKTNPEAYNVITEIVSKGELITAKMAPGGGHCMWIRPVTI